MSDREDGPGGPGGYREPKLQSRSLVDDLFAKGRRLRGSHIFARDDHDFYVEPAWCSEHLFAVEPFAGLIWDPAAGSGTIPRAARAAGLSNFATDIVDHGCGPHQDFLIAPAPAEVFNVVTNPPFRLARAFVERALTLGAVKTAVIFPTARLNAARWLKRLPLAKIYLLTPRPSMPPGEVSPVEGSQAAARRIFVGSCSIALTAARRQCGGCTKMIRNCRLQSKNKRPKTLLEHAPDQSEGVATSA